MTKIAICGAGPAGLTIGRLLEQANIPALELTIFEKDESASSRFYQGGTLDLHAQTGLAALRKAGLYEEFKKFARSEGEELIIGDKNATRFVHMKEAPQIEGFDARPEIDREKLKEILLKSVDPTSIRWGKHIKSINKSNRTLTFADGTEAGPFDLIIGAEGAWSKVRSAVSDMKPSYSGICGIEANLDKNSAGIHWESISKMVGQGSYFTFSDGKSLMAQRLGDGSLKIGTWFQKEQSWPADTLEQSGGDEEKIKRTLMQEYAGWDASLVRMLTFAYRFRPWPLYELPIERGWNHQPGWTLIGDSAHLMTPFAGEGVNTAMKDALELSEVIVEALQQSTLSLDEAVLKYEESMFPRAHKIQQLTAFNKIHMFQQDAPVGFLSGMIGVAANEAGYDIETGWLAWIPIVKVARCYFWTISVLGSTRRSMVSMFS